MTSLPCPLLAQAVPVAAVLFLRQAILAAQVAVHLPPIQDKGDGLEEDDKPSGDVFLRIPRLLLPVPPEAVHRRTRHAVAPPLCLGRNPALSLDLKVVALLTGGPPRIHHVVGVGVEVRRGIAAGVAVAAETGTGGAGEGRRQGPGVVLIPAIEIETGATGDAGVLPGPGPDHATAS